MAQRIRRQGPLVHRSPEAADRSASLDLRLGVSALRQISRPACVQQQERVAIPIPTMITPVKQVLLLRVHITQCILRQKVPPCSSETSGRIRLPPPTNRPQQNEKIIPLSRNHSPAPQTIFQVTSKRTVKSRLFRLVAEFSGKTPKPGAAPQCLCRHRNTHRRLLAQIRHEEHCSFQAPRSTQSTLLAPPFTRHARSPSVSVTFAPW